VDTFFTFGSFWSKNIKLFIILIDVTEKYGKVFIPGMPLWPSHIFVGNAGDSLNG
jgi:hypothetical protein